MLHVDTVFLYQFLGSYLTYDRIKSVRGRVEDVTVTKSGSYQTAFH